MPRQLLNIGGTFEVCPNPGQKFWYADFDGVTISPKEGVWSDDDYTHDNILKQNFWNPTGCQVNDNAVGWGNCFVTKEACQDKIDRNWFSHRLDVGGLNKRWAKAQIKRIRGMIESESRANVIEFYGTELKRMNDIVRTGIYF